MSDPRTQDPQSQPQAVPDAQRRAMEDLPAEDTARDASVKGGALRSGGDDDLEDLEVER